MLKAELELDESRVLFDVGPGLHPKCLGEHYPA